jgi:acetyl-CoA carboxylase carboxyl transferase subunit alpha
VIDRIVPEPVGGEHRDRAAAIAALGSVIDEELAELEGVSAAALLEKRRAKFLAIG